MVARIDTGGGGGGSGSTDDDGGGSDDSDSSTRSDDPRTGPQIEGGDDETRDAFSGSSGSSDDDSDDSSSGGGGSSGSSGGSSGGSSDDEFDRSDPSNDGSTARSDAVDRSADTPTNDDIRDTIARNTGGHGLGGVGTAPSPDTSARRRSDDGSDSDPWGGNSEPADDLSADERNSIIDRFVSENEDLVDSDPRNDVDEDGMWGRNDLVVRRPTDGDGFLVGPSRDAVVRERSDSWVDSWIEENSELVDTGPGDTDGGRFSPEDIKVRTGPDGSLSVGPSKAAIERERQEARAEAAARTDLLQSAVDAERDQREREQDLAWLDERDDAEAASMLQSAVDAEVDQRQREQDLAWMDEAEAEQFGDFDWSGGLGDPDEDEVENFVDEWIGEGGSEFVGDALSPVSEYLEENPGKGPISRQGATNAQTLVDAAESVPQAPGAVLEGVELAGYLAGGTRIVSGDNQVFVDRAEQTLAAAEQVGQSTVDEAKANPDRALAEVTGGVALSRLARVGRFGEADVPASTAARRATGEYVDVAEDGAARAGRTLNRIPEVSIERNPDAGLIEFDPMLESRLSSRVSNALPTRPETPDVSGTVTDRLTRAREGVSNSATFRRAAVDDRIRTVGDALSLDSEDLVPSAREVGRRSKIAEVNARLETEAAIANAREAAGDAVPTFGMGDGFTLDVNRRVMDGARTAGRASKRAEVNALLSAESAVDRVRSVSFGGEFDLQSSARVAGRRSKVAELNARLEAEAAAASTRETLRNFPESLAFGTPSGPSGELTAARTRRAFREFRADARAEVGTARDQLSPDLSFPSFGSDAEDSIFDTTIRVGSSRPARTVDTDSDLADIDVDPDDDVLGPFADDGADPFDFGDGGDTGGVDTDTGEGTVVRTRVDSTSETTAVDAPAASRGDLFATGVGVGVGVAGADQAGEFDDDLFGDFDGFADGEFDESVDSALDGVGVGTGLSPEVTSESEPDFDQWVGFESNTGTDVFDRLDEGTETPPWTGTDTVTDPLARLDEDVVADSDGDGRRRWDFDDEPADPDDSWGSGRFGVRDDVWDTGVAQSLDELQ